MNKEVKGWIIAIMVVIGAVTLFSSGMYYVVIKPIIDEQGLCSEKLNIPYDFWKGSSPEIHYESIDIKYYNCCYDEVVLTEEGYYTDKKCKGFVK